MDLDLERTDRHGRLPLVGARFHLGKIEVRRSGPAARVRLNAADAHPAGMVEDSFEWQTEGRSQAS